MSLLNRGMSCLHIQLFIKTLNLNILVNLKIVDISNLIISSNAIIHYSIITYFKDNPHFSFKSIKF